MKTNRRFRFYRKIVASILVFLVVVIPFVNIQGHSALRFDINELKLYFFGSVLWMDEFFIFLIVVLVFSLLFLWITIVFGRVWCGWACPQVILTDLAQSFIGKKKHPLIRRVAGHALAALLCLFVSANLIWFFIAPTDFFDRLFNLKLQAFVYQVWIGMAVVIWADVVLLGKVFCAKICPYARFQSVLYDRHTLTIAYLENRANESIECKKCIKDCPVGIDIRDGQHFSCVACAQCIDACDTIFKKNKFDQPSLIQYTYGVSNQRRMFGSWARTATFGFSVLLTGLLVFLLVNQTDTDIEIIRNQRFKPRVNREGYVLNAYQLSAVNKLDQPVTLEIAASIDSIDAIVKPNRFQLSRSEHLRRRVIVSTNGYDKSAESSKIKFVIHIIRKTSRSVSLEAMFYFRE